MPDTTAVATPSPAAPAKAAEAPIKPRLANGKFANQPGQTQPTKADAKQETAVPPEPPKEPYKFKRTLKVKGQDIPVELDEDGLTRELQIAHARAERLQKAEAQLAEFQALKDEKMDPAELLQKLGKDPDAFILKRLQDLAEQEALNEDQKAARKAAQERDAALAKLRAAEERDAKIKHQLQLDAMKQQRIGKYEAALKSLGAPEVTHELIYLMAETEKLGLENNIRYTPDELAKETRRRMDSFTKSYLGRLTDDALINELGKDRIAALLKRTRDEYFAKKGLPSKKDKAAPIQTSDDRNDTKYMSESEVNKRLRQMGVGLKSR